VLTPGEWESCPPNPQGEMGVFHFGLLAAAGTNCHSFIAGFLLSADITPQELAHKQFAGAPAGISTGPGVMKSAFGGVNPVPYPLSIQRDAKHRI
jgi:hypothetical protein